MNPGTCFLAEENYDLPVLDMTEDGHVLRVLGYVNVLRGSLVTVLSGPMTIHGAVFVRVLDSDSSRTAWARPRDLVDYFRRVL